MERRIVQFAVLITIIATSASTGLSQAYLTLENHLKQNLGLSQDQISSIRNGQPFAKALEFRTPAEIFVFG